ncbi:hypothetical protein F9K75_02445 [Brucella intermedia]|nr:hypothetical protein F9K75_02445 [Brucella intermedia]
MYKAGIANNFVSGRPMALVNRTGFAGGSNSRESGVDMSKTTNKFSPEVRDRAIHMVWEHEAEHPPPTEAEERYYAMLNAPAMAA